MLTIGVDVGGTFTDVFVFEEGSGRRVVHKVPSTPPNFGEGFIRGVTEALDQFGPDAKSRVHRVVHGTTVATNAILTQSGARLGFLLTEGCRDILYIGIGWRPKMYDLDMDPVEPLFLAPRRRSLEIRERVDVHGKVVTPLDEDHVREVARTLVEDHKVEAFVVCYLHSYVNADHERRTLEILRETYPHIPVTLSSDVLPRRREYRRLVVSGFDAYVKPAVATYLDDLTRELDVAGVPVPLQVMQSHGGIAGVQAVIERPIGTVLSGLAAGVIGAAEAGRSAGFTSCISLDMGGTSADVALIREGRPIITMDGSFEDYPLHIPMVDVRTIGAGGSSIAHIDDGGALKVGPRSAGARPGPVCYGRGGEEPTVTDASFALGYLNPETFSGGIDLDVERGLNAIRDRIARPLNLDPIEAALGIHRIVNSNMAQTMRLVSIKRGFDPREFAFIPCGGAGPVHAGRLAEEAHIRTILIPPSPGVLSAMGLMLAPLQHEALASFESKASETSFEAFASALAGLDAKCRARMEVDGVSEADSSVEYWADMRYVGQSHELQVPLSAPITPASLSEAAACFHDAHERTYNHANRSDDVEFAILRVVRRRFPEGASVFKADAALARPAPKSGPVRERKACFSMERGFETVRIHARTDLRPGDTISGPAIVEQSDTTTVIYPGHVASVDQFGNMIIQVNSES